MATPTATPGHILSHRQLDHYPSGPRRIFLLGVTVLTTIALYYLAFAGAGVGTLQSEFYGFSFHFLIFLSMAGGAVAGIAAAAFGSADSGRANVTVYGLLMSSIVVVFFIPAATGSLTFGILACSVSFIEGAVLVATPAIVRDFSPQLGRASAMGFWTLGPVLGSLVVSEVATNTLGSHPDWQFQYRVAGTVGLVVSVIAFFTLRELSPRLRDQVMVDEQDRLIIETKARGIDPSSAHHGLGRQMLRKDIVLPAFGISTFLLFYYAAVALLVPFFVTTFSYTESQANSLANRFWISEAVALVVAGVASDKLRVRKPFMLVGGLLSLTGVGLFALATNQHGTSLQTWGLIIVMIGSGTGIVFAAWMAAFTETIEKHNPAAVAAGLGVWGSILRLMTVALALLTLLALPAVQTLFNDGAHVATAAAGKSRDLSPAQNALVKAVAADPSIVSKAQALASTYKAEIATATKLQPATRDNLAARPTDPTVQAAALADITGLGLSDTTRILSLSVQYAEQIRTSTALDQPTLLALFTSPTPAVHAAAITSISSKLNVSAAQAETRLQALMAVPTDDLLLLSQKGAQVQEAGDQLRALGAVPAADLSFLTTYAGLADPAVVSKLTYLQKYAPPVLKAQADAPRQWSRFWWICFAAQLLLFPFIGMMGGRWSPARAKQDALDHEQAVARELAGLAEDPSVDLDVDNRLLVT